MKAHNKTSETEIPPRRNCTKPCNFCAEQFRSTGAFAFEMFWVKYLFCQALIGGPYMGHPLLYNLLTFQQVKPLSTAIFSPRLAEILAVGCDSFSFFASSAENCCKSIATLVINNILCHVNIKIFAKRPLLPNLALMLH